MARDDSVKDRTDTVLSPCGWREVAVPDLPESIRGRPEFSPFLPIGYDRTVAYTTVGNADEQERQLTALMDVLSELSPLLRIEFTVVPIDEQEYNPNLLHVEFMDTEKVPCGERATLFEGCADYLAAPQTVSVAAKRKSDDQLYGITLHELLHVLALMAHAEQGIMSTGNHWDGTYGLTDMDRAQLWLFSNPAFTGGYDYENVTTFEEAKEMVRYGEWEIPPP